MPKSKVRKKHNSPATAANRTPVKISAGPSSALYVGVMIGLMVGGLLWLIAYYLFATGTTPTAGFGWMAKLDAWNFAIGFGLGIGGLLMTMRWR